MTLYFVQRNSLTAAIGGRREVDDFRRLLWIVWVVMYWANTIGQRNPPNKQISKCKGFGFESLPMQIGAGVSNS